MDFACTDVPSSLHFQEVGEIVEVRLALQNLRIDASGGEQQMLAIAVALMSRPTLLLLDEPSLGLAPKMVQAVGNLIQELRTEGMTILLVEQLASMALSLADHAYALRRGRVVLSGTAAEMLKDMKYRDAYFGSETSSAGAPA